MDLIIQLYLHFPKDFKLKMFYVIYKELMEIFRKQLLSIIIELFNAHEYLKLFEIQVSEIIKFIN